MADRTSDPAPADRVPWLGVERLLVTDFRNYRQARVAPNARCVVLTGDNGAGKTNLLEALSLLAPGRGLRGAPFAELRRAGASGPWAVAGRIAGPHGSTEIGTGQPADAGDQAAARIVRIDGVTIRGSGRLGDYLRMLWVTPAMDRLFSGPAGDRRRFLDRLVIAFDPGHGSRVNAFEKAMRERNRLLDRPGADAAWFTGVEAQMAENAVAVAAARREAVARLAAIFAEAHDPASPFPWVRLALAGEIETLLDSHSALEAEDRYRADLARNRAADAAAGRTGSGPHRTDLEVEHGPKGIAAQLCSTGEQKALLIAMVLAHAKVIQGQFAGYPPILLLDEIAAHLDEGRRSALFEILLAMGAQVWMTGTDATLFDALAGRASFFRVAGGALEAQRPAT